MPLTVKDRTELTATFNGVGEDIHSLQTFLTAQPDEVSRDELERRLEVLLPQLDELTRAFRPLLQDRTDEEKPALRTQYEAIKALYYKLVAEVKQAIRQIATVDTENPPPLSSSQSVRCPKIKLPEFDGSTEAWMKFRDLFESMVHTNKHMANIEKFQYLHMSLKLPSTHSNVLDSYALIAENYEDAWKAICDRYNDKQKIISSYITSMVSVKKMVSESAIELRRVIDVFASSINSLRNQGLALEEAEDLSNAIITNLMLSRLDEAILREWRKHNKKDTFTYKELNDYLLACWRGLDDYAVAKKLVSKTYDAKPNSTPSKSSSRSHNVVKADGTCPLCNEHHQLWNCHIFQAMTVVERYNMVRSSALCYNCLTAGHSVASCPLKSRCRKCNGLHHTMIHLEKQSVSTGSQKPSAPSQPPAMRATMSPQSQTFVPYEAKKSMIATASRSYIVKRQSLIATGLVGVVDAQGIVHHKRALFDTGSNINIMTTACATELGLELRSNVMTLTGVAEKTSVSRYQTEAIITSRYGMFENKMHFVVMNQVTGNLPDADIDISNVKISDEYFLADPEFFRAAKVDMILSDELYYAAMLNKTHKLHDGPWMIHTKFGWVIGGSVPLTVSEQTSVSRNSNHNQRLSCCAMNFHCTSDELNQQLERFFTMEDSNPPRIMSAEARYCEDLYAATTTRGADGRYIVYMPMKSNVDQLGMNLKSTLRQFYSEENSRLKDEVKQQMTIDYVNDYINSNHMQEVAPPQDDEKCYYMPQHGVVKMTSSTTKLRRVSNASSKSETGLSLNDVSCVGPVVQPDLFDIIIRSREYKYILSADISRMFLQIWIHPSQTKYLRVVWRPTKEEPIRHYEMTTVTFGTASASFLASRTIVQVAIENENIFPESSRKLRDSIYMDDAVVGIDSISKGIKIRDEMINMLGSVGMNLRKFMANDVRLLAGLSSDEIADTSHENETMIKTLGVTFDTSGDHYVYHIKFKKDENIITKTSVLSCIASIFDPLGWIGPVVLKLKLLMKTLWLLKMGWDDILPENVRQEWIELKNSLTSLNELRIKRQCIIPNHQSIELHAFADASIEAYGCAIYLRSIDSDGNIETSLVCAKSKVAPKNQKTLARLELCAALLLARQVNRILQILSKPVNTVTLWTDSTIVLCWIRMLPATLLTFVGNRVAEIQELTTNFVWKHIRSQHNPADVISRGLYASDIIPCEIWWKGPSFFAQHSSTWPQSILTITEDELEVRQEMRKTLTVRRSESMFHYIESRFSRPQVLINVIAFIKRFIFNVRKKGEQKILRMSGPISIDEKDAAEKYIITVIQSNIFPSEYQVLRQQNETKDVSLEDPPIVPQISSKSTLISLAPFMDDSGVIRVRGRLERSPELTYDQKHPMILPQCHFALIIVRHLHQKYLHPGPKSMFSFVRQRYWIIRSKNIIKKVNFECIRCFNTKPLDSNQIMADLPPARVTFTSPFTATAIDYAGPYLMKSEYTRNSPLHKCYISMFKCMCTGAIHIELVSDLTTAAFLSALSRFTSRRGLCAEIYTDNATCFEGASNELKRLVQQMENDVVIYCQEERIAWKFTTPRASHAGGVYESGIKLMKSHLKRILTDTSLTFEQFTTVLNKVEAIVNSRPITPMTNDPEDLRALTPGHFLIGRPLVSQPERNLTQLFANRLTIWQRSQQLSQLFWKEWQNDYLITLQQRPRNFREESTFQVGDLVLIKESNLPPMRWMLGRVSKLFPGKDRVVRNVQVRTSSGYKERHVKYLCVLPIDDNSHSSRNVE